MEQNVKEYIAQKVKELIEAPSCCAEAKAAGTAWLEALGTDKEAEATKNLIAELEQDIIPIDGLIAFAGSDAGVQVFGEEKAKEIEAHAKEIKAHAKEIKEEGAVYCDCPACAAVASILEKKEELFS